MPLWWAGRIEARANTGCCLTLVSQPWWGQLLSTTDNNLILVKAHWQWQQPAVEMFGTRNLLTIYWLVVKFTDEQCTTINESTVRFQPEGLCQLLTCKQLTKTLGLKSYSWLINSCVLLISEFCYYINATMSLYSIIIYSLFTTMHTDMYVFVYRAHWRHVISTYRT